VQTDVTDPEQVEALAEAAKRAFGGFDIWINAAAVMSFGRVEDTPPDVLARIVQTNLTGHLYGSQAALQHFRARGRGVLINTGSVLGVVGQPFSAAYVATKFAIRGLSEALRQEVQGQRHIHVCTVSPAAIDTPIYQRAANYMGRELLPIRLLYPPRVVARACVRLAERPQRERLAGAAFGRLTVLGKVLAPSLAEWFTGMAVRLMEIGCRPAGATAGNVLHPVRDDLAVSGGWRRRYAAQTLPGVVVGAAGLAAVGLALLASRSGGRGS
jgi:NAD(P)-dependent dehydrogenase (short-subunit alcohol dehydrogenase family)